MKKIIDYKLVCSNGPSNVTNEVQKLLADDWQPYGTPMKNGEYIIQAMVKYYEE